MLDEPGELLADAEAFHGGIDVDAGGTEPVDQVSAVVLTSEKDDAITGIEHRPESGVDVVGPDLADGGRQERHGLAIGSEDGVGLDQLISCGEDKPTVSGFEILMHPADGFFKPLRKKKRTSRLRVGRLLRDTRDEIDGLHRSGCFPGNTFPQPRFGYLREGL